MHPICLDGRIGTGRTDLILIRKPDSRSQAKEALKALQDGSVDHPLIQISQIKKASFISGSDIAWSAVFLNVPSTTERDNNKSAETYSYIPNAIKCLSVSSIRAGILVYIIGSILDQLDFKVLG